MSTIIVVNMTYFWQNFFYNILEAFENPPQSSPLNLSYFMKNLNFPFPEIN